MLPWTEVKKCMDVLDEIKEGRLHNCFIEMSACEGSCARRADPGQE